MLPLRFTGAVAPILFFCVSFSAAVLTFSYDPSSQMISELGASDKAYNWLFNYGGFMPTGILLILFGFGLKSYSDDQNALLKAVPYMIMIHGLGMLLATWFSCDNSCMPMEPSTQQMIHNGLGAIKFPALHLALVFTSIGFWHTNRSFAIFSLLVFLISSVFMGLFINAGANPSENGHQTGLYQRLFIASLYAWIWVYALWLPKIHALAKANLSKG